MTRQLHLGLAAVLFSITTPALAGEGVELIVVTPATAGHARALVRLTDPTIEQELRGGASPSQFRVAAGKGQVQVGAASRLGSSDRVFTVLAFDQTGSFQRYWSEAFQLARAYADAVP